jgi:TatD DNase family protein
MLIDTHAHLDFPDFDKDRDDVIQHAKEADIGYIINIGTSIKSSRKVVELAEQYENLYAAVGIHPHEAQTVKESDYIELEKLAGNPKVVAIGEIGLDFYKDISPRDKQREIFIRQLQIAKKAGKPVVLHLREAHTETLEIIKAELGEKARGVAHCFSGSAETAKEFLDLGFYISIAGPVTYPNAEKLRAVIKTIPIERLLLETDCPFLAPQARRGLRNEPAYIIHAVEEFSKIYGLTKDDIGRITALNATELFKLAPLSEKSKIAYNIRNSLYLNITNRCTSSCIFCVTKFTNYVKGHNLRLENEPSVKEIIDAIGDPAKYKEVVFCGYGEPTMRLDIIKEVASHLKKKNIYIRLNTNGHGNLINNRSIGPELKGLVDAMSVSLNAVTPEQYVKICHPKFGTDTFDKVLDFVREAKQYIPRIEVTCVSHPDVDVQRCRQIAGELGVDFRGRIYNEVG